MKTIYEFTAYKKELVDENQISKDEQGNEIKVTKKVEKKVPVKCAILKPSRKLFDDSELFYGKKLAEGLEAGLMSRPLLAKMYNNKDGVFSKYDIEEYQLYVKEHDEMIDKLQPLYEISVDKRTDEQKEQIKILSDNIFELKRKIQDFDAVKNSLFEFTAEHRAYLRTLNFWVLNLSLIKDGENFKPFFGDGSVDEKMEVFDSFSEDEDKEFESKLAKVFVELIIAFIQHGFKTKDQFDLILANTENQDILSE